jgi:hypothetical protein
MRIGLLDVDGHNFPNLSLMKISAWHKSKGDNVEFADMFGKYDIIYKSKVFTYTADNITAYNCDKYIQGGTGYNLETTLPSEVDAMCPDYGLYNCQHAYGFTTRGCIRKCPECLVPDKEGHIYPYMEIDNFIQNFKSVIIMDNNILACDHGIKQIERMIEKGLKIDFNQGLDARLIDDSIAKLLSRVKYIRFLRMACDSEEIIPKVKNAIELIRWHNIHAGIFVYVLVKEIKSAISIIKFLKGMNVDPFAQAYRNRAGDEPDKLLKDFCTWVNTKPVFKTIPIDVFIQNRNRTNELNKFFS